jgi:GAF domain-containing protein
MTTPGDADHDDPVTDRNRLLDVAGYDIQSPALRASLDELARLAAERLGMPTGLVTIVLDGAQYFAGGHGLGGWIGEARGTPVEWSFCATTVRTGLPYVVADATLDEVQHDNPVVITEGVRCYAGAPLLSPDGHVLGACCVAGAEPHEFSAQDVEVLSELAGSVVAVMSRHRFAADA